jgi:DNA repair photolyase
MRQLTDAGVPCGVYLAPVLPGLTDSEEAIAAVAEAARDHGATAFWGGALRLAPLVKEHYFDFIGHAFPDLLNRYQRAYSSSDAPRDYRSRLDERIARVRARYGFGEVTEKTGKTEMSAVGPSPAVAPPVSVQLSLAMPGL